MPCEHYKDALMEAAASSGTKPQEDLRTHLSNCAACRAVFTEEVSLFSSIDAGLRVTANSPIPASFLQRVLARIAQETPARHSWAVPSFVLAGAAALILAFFVVQSFRRITVTQKPTDTAMKASPSLPVRTARKEGDSVPPLSARGNSMLPTPVAIAKNLASQKTLSARDANPEVLVPRDQEVLLAVYVEQLRQRKQAVLVADNPQETTLAPLQVAPIQIAQLDVKFLAEEQSQ
jgi:hypothetical protein